MWLTQPTSFDGEELLVGDLLVELYCLSYGETLRGATGRASCGAIGKSNRRLLQRLIDY